MNKNVDSSLGGGRVGESLSEPYDLDETVMKKSKKHCTGASSESEVDDPSIKNAGFGTHPNNLADPADLPDLPDPAEAVSSTAARTLPSTRAGGQDDGS